MISRALRICAAIVALTITPQGCVTAQGIPRRSPLLDSSVTRILAESAPTEEPVDLLRQVGGPQPSAKRREMADSLVGQAVRRRDATAILFVRALALAGDTSEGRDGTADLDAVGNLTRVYHAARARDTRAAVLTVLPTQVSASRALAFLRSVATSPTDDLAGIAIDAIGRIASERWVRTEDRAQAATVVRELLDGNALPNAVLKSEACRIARELKIAHDRRCQILP